MTEEEKKILLKWELILKDLSQFVQIAKINGIKFEVRTNEKKWTSQTSFARIYIERRNVNRNR